MSDDLCTECLLCSRKTRGKDLVRLAGHDPSSIETNATRAASLSRAQRFLLVFQSRKVGPDFPVLACWVSREYVDRSWPWPSRSTVEGNREAATSRSTWSRS